MKALLLLLLVPTLARADPMTFNFSGSVILGVGLGCIPSLPAVFGFSAKCGDPITGSFSYPPGGPGSLSVTIDGTTYSSAATGRDFVDTYLDDWVLESPLSLQAVMGIVAYGGGAYPFCGAFSGCYGRSDYPDDFTERATFQIRDHALDLELMELPTGNHFLSAEVSIWKDDPPAPVPEPRTLSLLAIGLLAIRFKFRKKGKVMSSM